MGNINILIPEKLHKELKIKAIMDSTTSKKLIIEFIEKGLK